MNLENARVLGLSRVNEFFDSDFRFGTKTSYNIQGYLLDLNNQIGVSGVLEASEFFRTGLKDYQNIKINGENFGKGRVTNFSVDESDFVQYTTYNLAIEGFESGNLYNLSGEYYSGLQELSSELTPSYLLESFSEDFDFQRSDDQFSYNHNVTIKFASGDNVIISPIDRAKSLATYIMTGNNPAFGFLDSQTSGIYTGNYKEFFTENYDKINNEVSISKNFQSLNPSGEYSIALKHSLNRAENGVTSVTENAQIKSHVQPYKTFLLSAVNGEISNSFERSSGVYENYRVDNSYELKNQPISINKQFNFFAGDADYSIEYTNDPAINLNYTWVFAHQIDKNGAFWNVTEDGEIKGLGNSSQQKFANAIDAFGSIKGGIAGRTKDFYEESIGTNDIFLIEKRESKNAFNGEINYTEVYTDEPTRDNDDLQYLEISIEDNFPVDYINTYQILGFGEIVQSINTTTLGQRNVNIQAIGKRGDSLNNILDVIKDRVNQNIPSGNDIFVANAGYNFNENERSLGLNVLWSYNRSGRNSELL